MRTVDLYINPQRNVEVDSTRFTTVINPTRFLRCEQVLLRIHLVDDAGAPVAIAAGLTFRYGLDFSFAAGNADPVASDNTRFVPDDWPGADGWDVTQGRICCRVNLNTTPLGTAMGTLTEKEARHAIWATPADAEPFAFFHTRVYVDNVTVEPGNAVAPDEPASYVTTAALAQLLNFAAGRRFKINSDGSFEVEVLP